MRTVALPALLVLALAARLASRSARRAGSRRRPREGPPPGGRGAPPRTAPAPRPGRGAPQGLRAVPRPREGLREGGRGRLPALRGVPVAVANARTRRADPTGPPVHAAVRSAAYEGAAEGEIVTLTATARGRGAAPTAGSGYRSTSPGPASRRRLSTASPPSWYPPTTGYGLLLEDAGPSHARLCRSGCRPPRGRPAHRRRSPCPAVPLSRLTLDVPGGATEVEVTPRLASTTTDEPRDGHGPRRVPRAGRSGRRSRGARTSRKKRRSSHSSSPTSGTTCASTTACCAPSWWRISRSCAHPCRTLTLAVPADVVTLYLQGDGLQTWERSDDGTTIDVELREPVRERGSSGSDSSDPCRTLPPTSSCRSPR